MAQWPVVQSTQHVTLRVQFEPRLRQLLCRDLEQVLRTQLLSNTTAVPPWHVSGSTSDWCALWEVLYKCKDTIQYNIMIIRINAHISSAVINKSSVCISLPLAQFQRKYRIAMQWWIIKQYLPFCCHLLTRSIATLHLVSGGTVQSTLHKAWYSAVA